jgi:serine phosphatase RsbU (regulator of sigma subunit)
MEKQRLARAEERNHQVIEQIILASLTQTFIVEWLKTQHTHEEELRPKCKVAVQKPIESAACSARIFALKTEQNQNATLRRPSAS